MNLERRINLAGYRDRRFLLVETKKPNHLTQDLAETLSGLEQEGYALQTVREGVAFLIASKGRDRFAEPMLTRTNVLCFYDAGADVQGKWYLAFGEEPSLLEGSVQDQERIYLLRDLGARIILQAEEEGRILAAPEGLGQMSVGVDEAHKDPYSVALLGKYLASKLGQYVARIPESCGWTMNLPGQDELNWEFNAFEYPDRDTHMSLRTCVLFYDRINAMSNPYGWIRTVRIAEDEPFTPKDHRGCWTPPPYRICAGTILDSMRDCGT